MAKKSTSKPKVKKKKATAAPIPAGGGGKTGRMKKAKNGFVITSTDDRTFKDTVMIAKSKKEAQEIAGKMLGSI